jgi:iron-sulfur cluster repair protein YtfE (RIC family)
MATDNDPAANLQPAPHGAFPVDRPVEALLRDHDLVRKLADACMNDTSTAARQQAAEQMLQALEMHARLEETVFYPAVRQVDAGAIGRFEDDHHQTDDMVAALRRMEADDPRREALLHDLIDATLHHIREEENDFFPKLDGAGLDMTAIGLQMQAFEANLVHMLAQASDQPARR